VGCVAGVSGADARRGDASDAMERIAEETQRGSGAARRRAARCCRNLQGRRDFWPQAEPGPRASEGGGKPVELCRMTPVVLTMLDGADLAAGGPQRLRQRRMVRLVEEARAQEGLLSQEDLARLLGCGVRTIRRDVRELRLRGGIHLATRGQEKDIGPGVTHRDQAVRLWLEGHEPLALARLFLQADAQGGCLTSAEVALLLRISPSAVVYYIKQWQREHGRLLPRRGTVHDIAYAVHMTPLLVAEYNRLIDQLGEENALLKHLLLSKRKEV